MEGSKVKLYDSDIQLKVIHVIALFKNNEDFLRTLFSVFETMEAMYELSFVYRFLENGSSDNTRNLLKEFVEKRKGSKLLCYKNVEGYKKTRLGQDFDRTDFISKLRNTLIQNTLPYPEGEWCLLIDSDIYFQANILQNIFDVCPNPSKDHISSISVYTQQLFTAEMLKRSAPSLLTNVDDQSSKLVNHYFDTFSFFKNSKSYFPYCAFEKCKFCMCFRQNKESKPLISESESIVDIDSGFGGFCLVKGFVLNHPDIKWGTKSLSYEDNLSLCEHVLFFERMKAVTNKRHVLLQNIDLLFRTG